VTAARNRYERIIEAIFQQYYKPGAREVRFERDDIVRAARRLKLPLPKNLGDVLYSFRYRTALPESITRLAPKGSAWIIRAAGPAQYAFVLAPSLAVAPSAALAETKIPEATPGLIQRYALSDEQALLAKLRYNRLVDIFTGLTCYSLQNHLRTTAPGIGQAELDEVYLGLDKRGVHYVLPVQAKGGSDRIGIVQIEQDFAVCAAKFPALICRSIAAQFMDADLIAVFELAQTEQGIRVLAEKHYRLVQPDGLSAEELQSYQLRPSD
jgi:hypothetical protein